MDVPLIKPFRHFVSTGAVHVLSFAINCIKMALVAYT